jgi:NDP-sugar pyrophosphorylase family protein
MSLTSPTSFFSLESFAHKNLFIDSEPAWDALKKLSSYLSNLSLGKIESEIQDGVTLVQKDRISIGRDCVIEPGAYIQGPCIIGDGTIIRHGAYIRGDVITGKNCVIGHSSEVKHSILLNNAAAAHFNYVGDSILGNHTNLGAGVICANLRLDKKPIHIIIAGKVFMTDMTKLGLILGDHSQLGCNSVSNPGTVFGKDSFCLPCVNVSGYVPDRFIVKGQQFSLEAK